MSTPLDLSDLKHSHEFAQAGGWQIVTLGGWLIATAPDRTTSYRRMQSLERSIQKHSKYLSRTIMDYLRKAHFVADFWGWDASDIVPVDSNGVFVDELGVPLTELQIINYASVNHLFEDLSTGSLVQRVQHTWQSLKQIKKSGPPQNIKHEVSTPSGNVVKFGPVKR